MVTRLTLLAFLVTLVSVAVTAFNIVPRHFMANRKLSLPHTSTTTSLFATMGPIARAKKLMDPDDYNRVVEEKMKQGGLTRKQAEDEYNAFLENPGFYYALDKKEEYYKSLGYKSMKEGRIGEAEKEGRGDEVRKEIEDFERLSKIKAYTVLAVAFSSFLFVRNIYLSDPDNFLPGI